MMINHIEQAYAFLSLTYLIIEFKILTLVSIIYCWNKFKKTKIWNTGVYKFLNSKVTISKILFYFFGPHASTQFSFAIKDIEISQPIAIMLLCLKFTQRGAKDNYICIYLKKKIFFCQQHWSINIKFSV